MAFNLTSTNTGLTSGNAGGFDLYLLAQSWQPEFCHGKYDQYPGCNSPQDAWRTQLTLHGLWPEYETGYPQNCGTEAFDVSAVTAAIGIDVMNRYWPNVKASEDDAEYSQFWEHEWSKHGTCSGLGQVEYFTQAVNKIKNGQVKTPSAISQNVGKSVSAATIRAAYGGAKYVALHCTGKYLSEVYTCWSKDSRGQPTTQRQCPDEVVRKDTCRDGMVRIATFEN